MEMNKDSGIGELQSRMAGAEANIQAIGRDVQQLTESLGSYAKETSVHIRSLADKAEENHRILLDRTDKQFVSLASDIQKSNKISWGPPIAGVGVTISILIALLGFAGSGYIRDMDRLEKVQIHIKEWQESHDQRVVKINSIQTSLLSSFGKRLDKVSNRLENHLDK